jgi:PTH1 family peptidyl-tRNA hydrolase
MIQLVVFLGNPGTEYARNRHNAAWLLAERLPFYRSLNWQNKYRGRYAGLDRSRLLAFAAPPPGAEVPEASASPEGPEKIHFLMPETYMNLSGGSVLAAASFFKIKPGEILILQDELELPLGTLSLKFSGGLGGHNGLRSMKASFGTADFWRLRIGIGRPSHGDVYNWVLSDFSAAEEELLAPSLDAAAALLLAALCTEPEKLLPEWAKKKVAADG